MNTNPKFEENDLHAIKVLVAEHFNGCDDQTIVCLGCSVYIEHFKVS